MEIPRLEARIADQPGTQGLSSAGDRHRKPENGLTNWIAHILRGFSLECHDAGKGERRLTFNLETKSHDTLTDL